MVQWEHWYLISMRLQIVSMNKKIIGVDLDGVVFDICVPIINYLKRKKKIEYTREHFVDYYVEKWANVTTEEMLELFAKPSTYRDEPIMPHAKHNLEWLYYIGFNLVAVTFRPKSVEKYTNMQLKKYDLPFSELYFAPPEGKIGIAKELNMSIFIEDKLDTAMDLCEVCDYSYIYNAPYNQTNNSPKNLIRKNNWYEISDDVIERTRILYGK